MAAGGLARHKGLRSSKLKTKYAAYRGKGTRELNKRKKIQRHIKKFPNDAAAVIALGKVHA